MTDMTFVSRRDRRRQTKPSLARAVASNAGTFGRGAAAAVAASGLVISSGVAANASTDVEAPEVTTLEVASSGLSVERASNTSSVAVTAPQEAKLSFDRPVVTSTPAPESSPAPQPEPAVEEAPEILPAFLPEPALEEAPEIVLASLPEPAVEEAPEIAPASLPTEQEAPSPQAPPQQEAREAPPQTEQANTGQQAQSNTGQQSEPGNIPQQSQGNTQVASSAPAQQEAPASSSGGNDSIVAAAYAGLGNPYSYGGTTTSGWDCSGFINWAYNQAGVSLPRTTYGMMASMRQVSSPSPGDIVIQNGGGHAAIYVGNGQLIGANNPRVGTIQYPLNTPYWSNTMYLTVN